MINNDKLSPRREAPFFNLKSNSELLNVYIHLEASTKESYSMDQFISCNPKINKPDYDKLTVIIPVRYSEDNDEAMENFYIILQYLEYIGVKHIIISEEDDYSKMNEIFNKWEDKFDDISLLFTQSHDEFNKPNAINEAIKKCITPIVAIMDYDVLVPKNSFDQSLSLVDSFYDFVYASNNYVKKINNKIELINDFNFENIKTNDNYELNYSNILFCKKEHLMKLGAYNTSFKKDYYFDEELLLRIILSESTLFYVNDYSYKLKSINSTSKNDLQHLINQYNLLIYNNLDVLINQNEDLYRNSIMFRDDVYPDTSNYLISVIIPVYNCEFFYIDRCITSLKKQTIGFENIEVILVDNASTHQPSIDLIKKYGEKYNNIKTIFLDIHSGAGAAINTGIKATTTEYITFLDQEDYFINNICEIAYNNMENEYGDMLITNFINLHNNNAKSQNWKFLNLNNKEKTLINCFKDLDVFKISPITGNKFYRKKFLLKNNLKYDNFKMGHQELFNEKTLFKAKNIKIIDEISVITELKNSIDKNFKSATLKYTKQDLIDYIHVMDECYKLYLINFSRDRRTSTIATKLNYFINELVNVSLSRQDMKIIIDESYDLFKIIKDKPYLISKKNTPIFNSFITKNYEEAFSIYNDLLK
ncbi:hypothetical protein TL18_00250 [Methanobrevibacter sp. YE315]|uniref:glycosyltransferase family A protein n=1 Tax=Methanobrevibacter sp. YE315 TaxID=1609968 RepID=UPI000764EF16|nr:glycosyltransferase family A protein [Methanobrevibacter sp. YE315]AMD16602.1 hypothetical protein TL18_00250 [Methanobrevibacter sp. YE315]